MNWPSDYFKTEKVHDLIKKLRTIICLMLLLAPCMGKAGEVKELEPVGTVYPIVEPNIVDEMKQRAALNPFDPKKAQEEYTHYQPKNLHKLPRATVDRTTAVDVTYTLDRDLLDQHGQVLYKKGFAFNPLDYGGLSGGLVIIDGSDPGQVEWYKKTPYAQNHRAILLLAGGYAPILKNELKRPVYYLTKEIAARLHIQAAPSVVVQDNKMLTLREVKIDEKKN